MSDAHRRAGCIRASLVMASVLMGDCHRVEDNLSAFLPISWTFILMTQHGPRSTATAAEARQLFNSLASFTPIVRSGRTALFTPRSPPPPPPPPTPAPPPPPPRRAPVRGAQHAKLRTAGAGRAHAARAAAEGRTV